MLVVTYDVNVETAEGARRLRQVAKLCERYGTRVQNSVFEVMVDATQYVVFKSELSSLIDVQQDSIRFYRLGNSFEHKIDVIGKRAMVEAGEPLMF